MEIENGEGEESGKGTSGSERREIQPDPKFAIPRNRIANLLSQLISRAVTALSLVSIRQQRQYAASYTAEKAT